MESGELSSALQALYSAEIDVSIISQWDAGWLVELVTPSGARLTQRFEGGEVWRLSRWVSAVASVLAPGRALPC